MALKSEILATKHTGLIDIYQGVLQLHQPISWTSTGPFLEASWSSMWQVDRPAPKR